MSFLERIFKIEKNQAAVTEPGKLYTPITGKYIPIEEIPDEIFSKLILGPGCGIEPSDGKVVAPINGTISIVANTKHAIGMITENGAEILIHIGMDTCDMNGKGFSIKVSVGDKVTCGQTLLLFDMDEIKAAGHPATTAFVITNSDEFSDISFVTGKEYQVTEEFGKISKTMH